MKPLSRMTDEDLKEIVEEAVENMIGNSFSRPATESIRITLIGICF